METVENIETLTHSEWLKYCIYLQEKIVSFQINFQKTNFNNEKLKHELDQLKKLVFEARHERFVPTVHPAQLPLALNIAPTEPTVVVATKEITYTRQQLEVKKEKSSRMKLPP